METKKTHNQQAIDTPHEISLKNRNEMKITGVTEVLTATVQSIVIKTSAGVLAIGGENLRIQNLNKAEKTVELNGSINEIKYNQKKKKLFEKIFK